MAKRTLAASSAGAETAAASTPLDARVLDARQASALYLLAKLKHVPPETEPEVKARLRDNAKSLRAALSHPFAREVARVLDRPSAVVSDEARSYAEYLIESAEPSAGHA